MTHVELAVTAPTEVEETVVAVLAACGTTGSWIPEPGDVRGFFRAPVPDLERRFAAAWRETTGEPNPFPVRMCLVPPEDWLAGWRAAVRPIQVGRLRIVPPGVDPVAGEDERAIVIEAGLGFGTGDHPTTRALLAWIDVDGPFDRIVDVGTGSGVLALAAIARGARWALGLDLDALALDNAARNRALNGTSALRLVRGSLDAVLPEPVFDMLVANLDGAALDRLLPRMAERLAPGGRCGVAGCLSGEREPVLARAEESGLELLDERHDPDPSADGAWWSGWFVRR